MHAIHHPRRLAMLLGFIGAFFVSQHLSSGEEDGDKKTKAFTAVYDVADLAVWRQTAEGENEFDPSILIAHIKSTVSPANWHIEIHPFAKQQSLIITQTQANHEKVAHLLDVLRNQNQTDAQAQILQALQGEWAVVEMEGDGVFASADEVRGMKWVIVGNHITGGDPNGATGEMSFTIDVSKNPMEIDLTALTGNVKDRTDPGVFSLDSDQLRVCFCDAGERPTAFSAAAGTGCGTITLKKIKR